MENISKYLIIIGVTTALLGVFLHFPIGQSLIKFLGNLPGDIKIEKDNMRVYFPITTSILLSVLLSLVFYFFRGR